jgi:hypothetical protein
VEEQKLLSLSHAIQLRGSIRDRNRKLSGRLPPPSEPIPRRFRVDEEGSRKLRLTNWRGAAVSAFSPSPMIGSSRVVGRRRDVVSSPIG